MSLIGTVSALALGIVLSLAPCRGKAGTEITESVSEDIDEANATQYAGIKGGSGRNHLENATTFDGNAPMFVALGSANFRLRLGIPALGITTKK